MPELKLERAQEAARAFTAVAATVRDRHGHRKAVRGVWDPAAA